MFHYRVSALLVFTALTGLFTTAVATGSEEGESLSISPVPLDPAVKKSFLDRESAPHVLADPDYRIWGVSVVQTNDGCYHAYFARWTGKHGRWLTHCEIAHAVSGRPEGPFEPTGVALASRNTDGWDIVNAHNPYAIKAGGTICLYYISNDLRGKFKPPGDSPFPSDRWLKENRWLVRNSQCIGVALAEEPSGPFRRVSGPVVKPHGRFKNIAVNPAVARDNGRFLMVMKGDDARRESVHRIQMVGHAEKPDGPFRFIHEPIYAKKQTEDAGVWYDKDNKHFYMVCHVMGENALAMFCSADGEKWKRASQPVLMKKEIRLSNGTSWKPDRLERPFVLTTDKGKPVMLYVAVSDEGLNGNIAIPFTD